VGSEGICPIRAPIADELIRFSGFWGSGVHATRKYGFTGLFLKNTRFSRFLTLQFSSLRLVSFFATCLMSMWGAKGSPEARWCPPLRSRRRIGGMGMIAGNDAVQPQDPHLYHGKNVSVPPRLASIRIIFLRSYCSS
jgi:hypothetical protein